MSAATRTATTTAWTSPRYRTTTCPHELRPELRPGRIRKAHAQVPWIEDDNTVPFALTEFYRVVNREMVGGTRERTFVVALIPKKVASIHTTVATAFRDLLHCVEFFALSVSIVLDFFIKTTGTGSRKRLVA